MNKIRQRKRRRRLIAVLAFLLLVVIIAVVGLFLYNSFQHKNVDNKVSTNKSVKSKKNTKKTSVETHSSTRPNTRKLRDNGNKPVDKKFPLTVQMDQSLKNEGFKGTALVVENGEVIFNKAYGESNQKGLKNSVDTPYPLASITKNITGVILVKELHKHGYNFQTKVDTFYPELPNAKNTTIKELVDMTSGYEVGKFSTKNMSEQGYINDVIKRVKYQEMFGPNGKWKYSAANYIIISGILHKLSNKSYEELLAEYIQPYYRVENSKQFFADKKHPISFKPDGKTPVDYTKSKFYSEVGTGDTFATPYTYYRLLVDEINGKLISKDQFAALTTPAEGKKYAGGMYYVTNRQVYGGHGIQVGYEPTYRITDDGKTGVFLFSNQQKKPENQELTIRYFTELVK